MKIKLRVPASSANLGSAFDCAGIAFELYNEFSFERTSEGVFFEGMEEKFKNENNLAYRGYAAVCEKIGVKPAVRIELLKTGVPATRGLGSSATFICAGAYAANALYGKPLSVNEVLDVANAIEGHPDNVTPALVGGLCIAATDGGKTFYVKKKVASDLYFTALIPEFELDTYGARKALPASVSRADAVYNLSRAALLSEAFETGDAELIKVVTEDRLHQDVRKGLIENSSFLEEAAYSSGAFAFTVSGAGPTCLCISKKPIKNEIERLISGLSGKWRAVETKVDEDGTKEI